jgi:hypothetical protein
MQTCRAHLVCVSVGMVVACAPGPAAPSSIDAGADGSGSGFGDTGLAEILPNVPTPCPPEDGGSACCYPSSYDDGGTGVCAPHWITGNGCIGGEVAFPCGLPPAPIDTGEGFPCATYCLGSVFLNECIIAPEDGGFAVPWKVDAGSNSVVVMCQQIQ